MKKRLRKKLRIKEFQELGFQVSFDSAVEPKSAAELAFMKELLAFVESIGLFIGGSSTDFYAVADGRNSATPEQQEALRTWLSQQPQVSNITIGPLTDAWYGHS